ncbi:acylphosphatase [Rhizobium terrae]|uniref:acylphosphatase n=1 Tax=Rhizobium terrae TaxID=2171756 RepID=UPI000E3E32B9|nr:acylphosphatase [Rhizobium terrae]
MLHDDETVLVRITGRVQGVGFRAWTQGEALRLGLKGWVRNEPDGSVLALIAGPGMLVSRMLDRLSQGPPGAVVSSVEKLPAAPTEIPADFGITR